MGFFVDHDTETLFEKEVNIGDGFPTPIPELLTNFSRSRASMQLE